MKAQFTVLFVAIFQMVFLSSCKKNVGEGGNATLIGEVEAIYVKEGSFDTLSVSAAPDKRVYIIYGDGNIQDDDTRTSPNGKFQFKYLNPGNYKIYTYSESLVNHSGLEERFQTVFISAKDTEVKLPKFTIVEYVK